jgi:hypothetical protein
MSIAGNAAIDVLIGLAFLYLLLSTVCSQRSTKASRQP